MTTIDAGFDVLTGIVDDPYQSRVEHVYQDDPELWRAAIGEELWFQFGLYEGDPTRSLDDAGRRYFASQLDLAGLPRNAPVARILDVGFGWGTTLLHLAERFPDCPRIDGVNISATQVNFAARRLSTASVADRVRPYLCNAQDIELIPDDEQPYDLVVLRGSIAHLTTATLESAMKSISARAAANATVVISETLYKVSLDAYESAIPDEVDRLACGNRKTLDQLTEILERNSFAISDVRELPSAPEAIRWLDEIKSNIIRGIADPLPRPFADLRDVADNLSAALDAGAAAIYSVIAKRNA